MVILTCLSKSKVALNGQDLFDGVGSIMILFSTSSFGTSNSISSDAKFIHCYYLLKLTNPNELILYQESRQFLHWLVCTREDRIPTNIKDLLPYSISTLLPFYRTFSTFSLRNSIFPASPCTNITLRGSQSRINYN